MDQYQLDCLVIGAGVVGLAVARSLALSGREVWVIEREHCFGSQTSSRNSEVIHAGIYYPQGSLKARLCVDGKHRLYDYCQQRGIAHRPCGKLIVAHTPAQLDALASIKRKAQANDVHDLNFLDRLQALALEPHLSCLGALFSPSTGIIDSHALMQSLLADAESAGASLVFNTELQHGEVVPEGVGFELKGQHARIVARHVVNCAGLQAVSLAADIAGFPSACLPQAHFAKGSYFSYAGAAPFSRLIYPVPEEGGLGTHLTLDLQGRARFGPDVEWLSPGQGQEAAFDYRVNADKAQRFYQAIRQYWPHVEQSALQADYAGIRPKLSGPGDVPGDFLIQSADQHGIAGLVNLFGIESPGLTASLAIADYVRALL